MEFSSVLRFLGTQERESKKTGKPYYLAKFMHEATNEIYEFYVPSDRIQLVTNIAKTNMFDQVKALFEVTSFNSKPQLDLKKIALPKENENSSKSVREDINS